VDDGIAVLRERGAKITAQRIAILQQLEGRTDHPSADTLYRELSAEYSTMSVATLYSTAQLLADAGLIKILSIDDKRVYFDPTTTTHGGKLFDIPVDEDEIFKSASSVRENIAQIERTEIFFYGLCTDCLKI
ncbi:MAG: transcriptional repressor, partial [Cloacibacillus porcorum]|nr:transcriptional repressor [Cloacibacillus porcorum]